MKAGYHQVLRFCLTLLKAIYLFLPGIIFLLAYYFIIVKIDIGQDMLMQAYENDGPFFWTIVVYLPGCFSPGLVRGLFQTHILFNAGHPSE